MRHVGPALAVLAVALAAPLDAQDAALERLRAAVDAAPSEPRHRCELASALVRAERHREAVEAASAAIDALRARTDATSRRVLGACLYNRGRAHEGLDANARAIGDYADSLDLRPNDTVAARLAALAPGAPPALAAFAATLDGFAFDDTAPALTRARTRDRVQWSFVPSRRMEEPTVVAVARLCGVPRAAVVTAASFDDYGQLGIERATARVLGDVDGVVVRVAGTGDATCGRMDGVMDARHEATAVVFADGCEIRVASFVTSRFVCDQRQPDGVTVRLDASGHAVTSRRAGHQAPPARIGTFRIRDLAR
ncbi:MAG: hypothetical protein KF729_31425 [Sandaracinaceae bacterium]|nr:hypothetical protein [Sandaracinaceae bacterium]